jgi:hypothetical protein
MALSRAFRVTLAFAPLVMAAACVPQSSEPKVENLAVAPPAAVSTAVNTPQPRTATYSCADGGRMTIENLGTSVRVLGPDGASEDLPASPANQTSRFGEAHDAIVIEGREALMMKGGATPLTCTR